MSKRKPAQLTRSLRTLPLVAALVLLGCGTSQQSVIRQDVVPVHPPVASAPIKASVQSVPAAAHTQLLRRYQCATRQGFESLELLYQGHSPLDAASLTLQRGAQSFALSRHPSVRGLFMANDERLGYRWLVAENGVGSLRVRAPTPSAVETEVLTACQPT